MKNRLALACLLLATGLALPAFAQQEAAIKKTIEAKLGAPVTSVQKTGYLGLYEVYVNGQILYTDAKVSAILAGNLIDAQSMTSVTEARLQKLNTIKFADLPLQQAIKQVRGNGKRILVSFEDPNCSYCKRLAKDLAKLDNVTLYTFLYPILSEDSIQKSRLIWCAPDKAKAWNDWMLSGKMPGGKDDCDTTAIINNQELGQKLHVTGTPTLFFADGERFPGAVPLAKIEAKLNAQK
jgi:thiol:disulfide interchange protein DsbC